MPSKATNAKLWDTDLPSDSKLFNFTRGRFVINEQHELSQCHRIFNVTELARYAAKAVQADRCLTIRKLPDGMFNRVLLLSMDNGKEVVAKIPNPNAGQPHLTTASEVATMKFVREVLGTPLPEVYAWSSRTEETLVGAKFILMEKMDGVELEHFLPKMKIQDRLEVVKALAGYQRSWASVSSEQFGSLYFSDDIDASVSQMLTYVDQEGRKVNDPRFVVGPSTGREMFDDGRASIKLHRGPWHSLEDYHTATGKREITSVQHIPQLPPSPVTLRGPGLYQPTREKKLHVLETYMKLFTYLFPIHRGLRSSHIWHGDLHAGNIFVDPAHPTKVVARQPHFLDHQGPAMDGLERPVMPVDFVQLDANEKKNAQNLFLQQSLCALYRTVVYRDCPKIFECFVFQESMAFTLLLLARNILIDGEATYMAQVCELEDIWKTLLGTEGSEFPLSFKEAESRDIAIDLASAKLGVVAMQRMRNSLGDLFPENGYVESSRHEEAVDALSRTRD
ncbi:hypothetical protein E4T51_02233 [Aureobasidium sp. EXF-12344]|nr:hypothetical protein E4T51_02233 [Aureobasidium sp. EXF-12344]